MKTTLIVKTDDLKVVAADASNSGFANHDRLSRMVDGKRISAWIGNSIAFSAAVDKFPEIAAQVYAQADAERERKLDEFRTVSGMSFSIPVKLHKFNWLNFWIAYNIHHRRSIARRKIARYYRYVTM